VSLLSNWYKYSAAQEILLVMKPESSSLSLKYAHTYYENPEFVRQQQDMEQAMIYTGSNIQLFKLDQ
jgi:hypothetical protein